MKDQPPNDGPRGQTVRWRPSALFQGLLSLLNSIGTVWIFALMVVITVDVVGRTVFTAPLPGVLELVRLSIVGIVFIQLGHTLRAGRLTRADNLILKLQARVPRLGFGMQAVFELAGTAVFVVLFQASVPLFFRSWASGEYAGVEGYVTYPVWPVRLIILIGTVCAGVQFLLFAWRDATAAWRGRAPHTDAALVAPEDLTFGTED
ncbi:MAG TPA: TRAP transporter small permease [Pseudolabrys sp.]|nr:TRAP transporter small permease [Pseudolabrys sp.]